MTLLIVWVERKLHPTPFRLSAGQPITAVGTGRRLINNQGSCCLYQRLIWHIDGFCSILLHVEITNLTALYIRLPHFMTSRIMMATTGGRLRRPAIEPPAQIGACAATPA
jgi:hypothetical protein